MLMSPDQIEQLCWPKDKVVMGQLNVEQIQQWYLSQPMQYMVFLGQDKGFKRFIFWHYTIPVRCLRTYYKFKKMFRPDYGSI